LRECLLEEAVLLLPAPSALLGLGDPPLSWYGKRCIFLYNQECSPREFYPCCGVKNNFKDLNEDCKGESRKG